MIAGLPPPPPPSTVEHAVIEMANESAQHVAFALVRWISQVPNAISRPDMFSAAPASTSTYDWDDRAAIHGFTRTVPDRKPYESVPAAVTNR